MVMDFKGVSITTEAGELEAQIINVEVDVEVDSSSYVLGVDGPIIVLWTVYLLFHSVRTISIRKTE